MSIDKIYLVSDKITPVPTQDVDRLQSAIGSLPNGYREYIERFGAQGKLCEFFEVWAPANIIAEEKSEREYTTGMLIDAEFDYRPFRRSDLSSLWVIGRGESSTLVYSHLHPGVIFNVARRGAENEGTLIRHPKGLTDAGAMYWWGQARHPFPFFVPKSEEIDLASVHAFRSNKPTDEIANDVSQYWADIGSDVKIVRMPSKSHEDSVYVFVKRIGGYITVNRNKHIGRKSAYGSIFFEKAFSAEVAAFEKQFGKAA